MQDVNSVDVDDKRLQYIDLSPKILHHTRSTK